MIWQCGKLDQCWRSHQVAAPIAAVEHLTIEDELPDSRPTSIAMVEACAMIPQPVASPIISHAPDFLSSTYFPHIPPITLSDHPRDLIQRLTIKYTPRLATITIHVTCNTLATSIHLDTSKCLDTQAPTPPKLSRQHHCNADMIQTHIHTNTHIHTVICMFALTIGHPSSI